MNEDLFFKGKGLSAVPEVALSFNVGPGPVSIGLAYFNAPGKHVEKTVEKAFRGAVFIQLEIS